MQLRPRRFIEIVEILWQRKKLIFFVTLAMLIATYGVIRRVPFLYESKALVVIANLQEVEDGMPSPNVRFTSVMQQMKSLGTLAQLVREHQLYPQIPDRDEKVNVLRKGIVLDVKNRDVYPEGPESVTIAFRYNDRQTAQTVVRDLVGLFERSNEETESQAINGLNKLKGEIVEIENRLRQIGSERDLAMLRSQAASRMASDAAAMRTQRMNVESTIDSLTDRALMLENQIALVKRQIDEQEKIVSDTVRMGGPGNAAYGALLVRKTELEAQLKIYQTQYTEKNPKVIALREQIYELNKQMARMSTGGSENGLPLSAPEMVELRKLKQELSRLETEREINQRDLQRKSTNLDRLAIGGGLSSGGMIITEGVSNANRAEYDRLAIQYNRLIEKQDKLSRASGVAGATKPLFDIVDKPNLPMRPVAPNPFLLGGLAFGLSLGLALLVALIIELPKIFYLNDERDIEYYLGAPVLALIPESVTPNEKGRHQRIRMMRGLLLLLLLSALVPALFFIIDGTKIFQILGSR